jgi:hypothetical protein
MLALHANRAANPSVYLVLGLFKDGSDKPTRTLTLTFMPPAADREEDRKKPIEHSSRLLGPALTAMADMLAPNIAAANRAFFGTRRYENSPSVPPDELSPTVDPPRATTPTANRSHLEASEKKTKSQVSFESYGGSSVPSTSYDEDRTNDDDVGDRADRPPSCAA